MKTKGKSFVMKRMSLDRRHRFNDRKISPPGGHRDTNNTSRTFSCYMTALFLVCGGLVCGGCQFRTPSIAEQEYLMKQGAFPSGPPGWIATPHMRPGEIATGNSGGLIPQSFSKSALSVNNQGNYAATQVDDATVQRLKVPSQIAEEKKEAEKSEPDSPLHRIVKICPSLEQEVSSALMTTDVQQRIRKYESLTNRCPQSWDLWLWLGKDYDRMKKPVQAGRCYEKVVVLDNTNTEAANLLAENRKHLNEKAATTPLEKEKKAMHSDQQSLQPLDPLDRNLIPE